MKYQEHIIGFAERLMLKRGVAKNNDQRTYTSVVVLSPQNI